MKILYLSLGALLCSSAYAKDWPFCRMIPFIPLPICMPDPKPKPVPAEAVKDDLMRPGFFHKDNCPYFAVIYARDEDKERGNIGEVTGVQLYKALHKTEQYAPTHDYREYLMMQGVNYKNATTGFRNFRASAENRTEAGPYVIAHPAAVKLTRDLITNVTKTCGQRTNIVLAGYMRGVDVMRFATFNLTESEKSSVLGLIAYSDDKFLSKKWPVDKRYPSLGSAKVLQFCRKSDDWCHFSNMEVNEWWVEEGDKGPGVHYGKKYATKAAKFILDKAKQRFDAQHVHDNPDGDNLRKSPRRLGYWTA